MGTSDNGRNETPLPADSLKRFQNFRAAHLRIQLKAKDLTWTYLSGGAQGETLLLLPGSWGNGEELYYCLRDLEKEYHLICPSYPPVRSINCLVDGILSIMDAEEVYRFSILGHDLGGALAQILVREYPDRVNNLILSHTSTASPFLARSAANLRYKQVKASQSKLSMLPLRLQRFFFIRDVQKHFSRNKSEEKDFLDAYLRVSASQATPDYLSSRTNWLADFYHSYFFYEDDLQAWPGKILLLESEDDLAVSPVERDALKKLYPQAQVHTFQDGGHLALFFNTPEALKVIEKFMEEDFSRRKKAASQQVPALNISA